MGRILKLTQAIIIIALIGCSGGGGGSSTSSQSGSFNANNYASSPNNFKILLTDAPRDDLKEVNVNIKHIEMLVEKNGNEARLRIANGLGMLNLLTLQNGVTLPVGELNMPTGITIKQIRLVLEDSNNHAIKSDDSRCDMQTPSAQQTGVKIILNTPVTFEDGYNYSMTIDFDALKSVVIRGNGTCLLKPVLKIPSFTRVDEDDLIIIDDPIDVPEEDVTDGTDDNSDNPDDDGSGFDDGTDDDGTIIIDDPNLL